MITKEILVEELVEKYPTSVSLLSEKGLVCIICGEPVWGSLEELAKSKSFSKAEIEKLLIELKGMVS